MNICNALHTMLQLRKKINDSSPILGMIRDHKLPCSICPFLLYKLLMKAYIILFLINFFIHDINQRLEIEKSYRGLKLIVC